MRKKKICRKCKKPCYGTYCMNCHTSKKAVGSVSRARSRKRLEDEQ